MSSRTLARARFGAAVAIAFASGIIFASGFDLTRFGYAQSRGNAAKPTVQEVKPIADASNVVVRTLVSAGARAVGSRQEVWDGKTDSGQVVPDGQGGCVLQGEACVSSASCPPGQYCLRLSSSCPPSCAPVPACVQVEVVLPCEPTQIAM